MTLQEIKQQIEFHQRAVGELKFAAKQEFIRASQSLANNGFFISVEDYEGQNSEIIVKVNPEDQGIKSAFCELYEIAASVGVKIGYCEFKKK